MDKVIEHDLAGDGIDRRGFLKCMAWVGTGLVWTVGAGIPGCNKLEESVAVAWAAAVGEVAPCQPTPFTFATCRLHPAARHTSGASAGRAVSYPSVRSPDPSSGRFATRRLTTIISAALSQPRPREHSRKEFRECAGGGTLGRGSPGRDRDGVR
jgi:hypothetical protein